MNQLMNTEVKMTSLELAETTGKQHAHIMRDIKKELEQLTLEDQSIFGEIYYLDIYGRQQPCYTFGREGAMQLALRYDASVRRKVIKKLAELETAEQLTMSPELKAIIMVDKKQQVFESRLEVLENTSVIDHRQQLELSRIAKAKVIKSLGGSDSAAFKDDSVKRRAFQGMWRDYKDFMEVASYKDTPKVALEEGKKYIDQWVPSGRTYRAIMIANGEVL